MGETKPLKELGVLIDEEIVKNYAWSHGIAKVGAELNQAQKVQARVALITAGLSKAQGDVARTADEVANASRGVTGRIEALAETIGTQLQPIAKTVLSEISAALSVMDLAWQKIGVTSIKSASGSVTGMGYVQSAVGQASDAVQIFGNAWIKAQANMTGAIASMVEMIGRQTQLNKVLSIGIRLAMGDISAIKEVAMNFLNPGAGKKGKGFADILAEELRATQDKLNKEFEKASGKALPSVGINKAFTDAQAQLQKLRGDLGKGNVDPNSLVPIGQDAIKKPEKLKEAKFSDAMERGSQDATNTILRSKYGGGRSSKELERIAKNGEEANKHLAKIAGAAKPEISKTSDYEVWRDFG